MRAAALALALACGCSAALERPPPPAVTIEQTPVRSSVERRPIDPIRPAEDYLGRELSPATRFTKVAFVGALYGSEPVAGAASLTPPDAERREAGYPVRLPVVEERATSVRAVVEADGVRLVAYLLHADLHPVVRRRARAALGGRSRPVDTGRDGVWIRPGVVVRDQGKAPLHAVALKDPAFEGTGWVEREAIERVFEPDEAPPQAKRTFVKGGSRIFAEGGALLCRLPSRGVIAVDELERDGRRVRIRYVSAALWIEGWVNRAAVDDDAGAGYGSGRGRLGGRYFAGRYLVLHEGDRLRDPADGELVGVVTGERVRVHDEGPLAGGRRVSLSIAEWSVVLWVSAADLERGERWERIYQQRARITAVGGGEVDWPLASRRDDVASCWGEALERDVQPTLQIPLTWRRHEQAEVGRVAGLDTELHACLQEAFDDLALDDEPPPLPRRFTIELDPAPLPERTPR